MEASTMYSTSLSAETNKPSDLL